MDHVDRWSCVSVTAAVVEPFFWNNGNSFATPATIGTNNAQPLIFETNDDERLTILANGNVGICTTNPGSALEVIGSLSAGNLTGAQAQFSGLKILPARCLA